MRTHFHIAALVCALWVGADRAEADEVQLEEAGLSMTLPAAWAARHEISKIPTGQTMQRWVRAPVLAGGMEALPGLTVLATPVAKEANLALISQAILGKPPYSVKLAAETECLKCVSYKFKTKSGLVSSMAPDLPPNCEEYRPGVVPTGNCIYRIDNRVGLTLEPSWVHRFEKEAAFGKMSVVAMHALVEGKFVDLSFFYPQAAAAQIEPEIAAIAASIKRLAP